ncbi:DUF3857 domain-containing protein [Mucilaginibacter sp. HMF5004]|uniref:DUF3857 domain-containing protein n=1 Tax=Mucilaginibacter rivuli TaxID=2857527 RepID=UPI001C5EF6F5|nr:DUF3857 domain-containing protein [Mucilaginibacter rivuli]MBW4889302.1 DUF3857 domain-containing protein [Mucilaginibacter rivuli]
MKKIFTLLFTISVSFTALCQDFDFGKIDAADMNLKKYDKDTSAHAVVLREFGKSFISDASQMPLIHEYHVRIKIFDSKGFNQGDVAIYLYTGDNNTFETVRDIKGITFYTDENGLVRKTELESSKIFHEKRDKHREIVKFAMPNLRDGCIIEYTYTTESPYHFNFHPWIFQSEIPKMYSEYEAHIPAIYEFNTVLRGYLKLSKNTADLEQGCFSYYGIKADCSKIMYAIKDIPAFIEEDYMTAASNYISAIYYELSAMTNQYGKKEPKTQEWKDVDYNLKHNESFGDQMKRTGILKDHLPPNLLAITDTLQKAKAIYTYLQKWFKFNNDYTKYSNDGIKKAIETHTGSVGDINLTLISALNTAGINADAVILSTRKNGIINKLYPVISEFNYVVARIEINNHPYLLDATDPMLPFGLLPLHCINDQGRVMSLTKPSYWIDMVQPQKRNTTTNINLALQANGKIKGTITNFSIGYAAYEKRKAIKKFNSMDEYAESVAEKLSKAKITKWDISGVDTLDQPIVEKYDIEFSIATANQDIINFNPSFYDKETQNPFKLDKRTYPVDLGSAISQSTTLTLSFPENYTIAEQPAPVAMGLPNNGGKFLTSISAEGNLITYAQIEQLSKAIYFPEEYPYLRELFNKIIQHQKANIVFKKKP